MVGVHKDQKFGTLWYLWKKKCDAYSTPLRKCLFVCLFQGSITPFPDKSNPFSKEIF